MGDWGFMTSSFRDDPTIPCLENVLPAKVFGKGQKEGKVRLFPVFETSPRDNKNAGFGRKRLKRERESR